MTYNISDAQQPIRDVMKEFGPELEHMGRKHDRQPAGFAHDVFHKVAARGPVGFLMPKQRVAFGGPIAKLQAIRWLIADMSVRVEAARLLTYKAAQKQDAGERLSLEAANFCVDRTMQIHADYGYIDEFSIIEKLCRDQRMAEMYEGTSEVQRLVIANNYLRG